MNHPFQVEQHQALGASASVHPRMHPPGRERGVVTLFASIIVLALMTLLLIYSSEIQESEQRISGNEYRNKLAFHAAESGAGQALEYLLANNARVLSAAPAGANPAGWFDATDGRWTACPGTPAVDHPCGGELAAGNGANSYFYDDPATAGAGVYDSLPVNTGMLPADTTVRVSAVLCLVDPTNPVGGCMAPPAPSAVAVDASFIVTVLAYGYADCTDSTDPQTCLATATVAFPLSNFNIARGSPPVPLTTRTTFPPTGTAEVVPNPNAGGVGVPISVWANANPSCSDGAPTLASGSWATCEYHEWYESDGIPDAMACEQPTCACSQSESISYTAGIDDFLGIDLLEDPQFPCDLFEYFFGIPRSQYQLVKSAAKVISDCTTLDETSQGIYWVTGAECDLQGSSIIGSPTAPVMLISAAGNTTFSGLGRIFGVVFVTDVEVPGATWDASGTNIVYGAMIIDAELDGFVGTFKIVYNPDVALLAAASDGIGTLSGGWRDFGLPALAWEG